jgi:transcriptional regulator with XRE-family HTH domain
MARKFEELRGKMSPESRRKSEELASKYRAEMALDELRVARQLTQESLARTLNVNQAAISKMERRTDMYLSTLRSIIKAMGGELVLQAVFPDGRTELDLRPTRKADSVRRSA